MPTQGNTYTFEDLSGTITSSTDPNPYNALIAACDSDPAQIQSRYATHRIARAAQQREKLIARDFPGVNIDPTLRGLLDERARTEEEKTGYKDERNCFVFWARPPARVSHLVAEVQSQLLEVMPNLWTMPSLNLHLTALEITHSRTPSQIQSLVSTLNPKICTITDYTLSPARRPRLIKPMLTYDASAIAISYLPAAGDKENVDKYTYHHLRRDVWEITSNTSATNTAGLAARETGHSTAGPGVKVESRYVVPSAHLTIARFVTAKDTTRDRTEDGEVDLEVMKKFVERIDEINEKLEQEYWPQGEQGDSIQDEGQWIVGEEQGLDCRWGTLWYGEGETVRLGKGF